MVRSAFATAGMLQLGGLVPRAADAQRREVPSTREHADSTLALARFVNNTAYRELPPKAIEHAKMILASTFASAAVGSTIESARILRQLAKEQGGTPEATIWFDGRKLPVAEAARVLGALGADGVDVGAAALEAPEALRINRIE